MENNLIYCGQFKWKAVYIEEEPDIEKDNQVFELRKILYDIAEKEADEYLDIIIPN